ncbi:MAG: SPOR domain-containing protein [Allosphingosinicella sp.]
MTDIRADEDDRLPWLEAVEEEGEQGGPSAVKLIVAVLIGLAAIGGIVGGVFWMSSRDGGGHGAPELIRAPQGDYKVKPADKGGMAVEGEGDTAFDAAQGADPKGAIDTSAVPEAPVAPQPKAQPAPAPATKAEPPLLHAPAPTNAPAAEAPAASAGGASIQLGAFPSQAAAEKAWKAMAGRFSYLAPLSHSVVSANVNGKTYFRLRASGPDAAGICGRLRVAGENCFKV